MIKRGPQQNKRKTSQSIIKHLVVGDGLWTTAQSSIPKLSFASLFSTPHPKRRSSNGSRCASRSIQRGGQFWTKSTIIGCEFLSRKYHLSLHIHDDDSLGYLNMLHFLIFFACYCPLWNHVGARAWKLNQSSFCPSHFSRLVRMDAQDKALTTVPKLPLCAIIDRTQRSHKRQNNAKCAHPSISSSQHCNLFGHRESLRDMKRGRLC